VNVPQATRPRITPFIDIAALVGLAGIAAGTVVLGPTDLGFDRAKAITALFSWIPVTLGPGLLVLAVVAVEVAVGAILARAIRGRAFEHVDEAILQGFVLAVVKDVVLLGLVGGLGLFRQPVLAAADAVVLVAGFAYLRPVMTPAAIPRSVAITPFGVLLVVAWAAPLLLQLASPVVPFVDVLPNHVAPAEHLRTFGTLTNLTDTQSPIYGASRIFLGYTALLGSITTTAGIPAGQALAGFILPSTILVAVAVRRLAVAVGGADIAPWALLAFAMTTSFARLGDARATVIVLPLVTWALAAVAEALARDSDEPATTGASAVVAGLGLGGAMLIHPVIGFLAAATVLIVVLGRPSLASLAIPALATGGVMALPQVATMVGISLPPFALAVAVLIAVAVSLALGIDGAAAVRRALVALGRGAVVIVALGAVLLGGSLIRAAAAGANPLVSAMELSFVAAGMAVALRTPAAQNPVVWAALAAGFAVATVTQLVPEQGSGLLGEALRFELPKTLHYWVPVMVAILAGGGLAAVARLEPLPTLLRGVAMTAFIGAAALPIRAAPIDAFHLGEHRLSETLSISMRWVQRGFWQGYPDTRYVLDAPRQAVLDAVRTEIVAGRIGPDTPILHVAGSFQQWVATPLGVFDGVTETDVTPDAEVSIHTVGGRLHGLGDLDRLLASGDYAFVLFEPSAKLPTGTEDRISAAGYARGFSNRQGTLYRFGP